MIETNEGVHKENRGKERKVMLKTELPCEFYRFPRYIQSDLFMNLFSVDQES